MGVFYLATHAFARVAKAMHAAHPTDPEHLSHEQVQAGLRDYPWFMRLLLIATMGAAMAAAGTIWLLWRIVE